MILRGYQIQMPKGDRLVILRGATFDQLIERARLVATSAPRPRDANPSAELPAWLDDHIETDLIVR